MSRSIAIGLAALAGAASIAAPAIATPAIAATAGAGTSAEAASAKPKVVYGYAWADGPHTLRITPLKAKLDKSGGTLTYKLKPIKGAKELRVDYAGADFRRVTSECGLKETEGVVKVDKEGLGRTRCTDDDLDFVLELNPAPVRITLGRKVLIQEFVAPGSKTRTAFGTVKRVSDNAVEFRTGGKSVKLGYTLLGFNRVTKRCGDRWLANRANVSRSGLGTKECDQRHFTKALKTAGKPVRVKAYYDSLSGRLIDVWESTRR